MDNLRKVVALALHEVRSLAANPSMAATIFVLLFLHYCSLTFFTSSNGFQCHFSVSLPCAVLAELGPYASWQKNVNEELNKRFFYLAPVAQPSLLEK